MKKSFLLLAFICFVIVTNAQIDSSAKNFYKYENLPAFNLNTVPDSASFTNKKLDKTKPLMILFFSPDCEHCQRETKDLLAYKEELKNLQIVMVSPTSYVMLQQFYKEYGLSVMPNIKMAQDLNYSLGSIYQIKTFPSMYVYNKSGKLLKAFAGNIEVPVILEAIK